MSMCVRRDEVGVHARERELSSDDCDELITSIRHITCWIRITKHHCLAASEAAVIRQLRKLFSSMAR